MRITTAAVFLVAALAVGCSSEPAATSSVPASPSAASSDPSGGIAAGSDPSGNQSGSASTNSPASASPTQPTAAGSAGASLTENEKQFLACYPDVAKNPKKQLEYLTNARHVCQEAAGKDAKGIKAIVMGPCDSLEALNRLDALTMACAQRDTYRQYLKDYTWNDQADPSEYGNNQPPKPCYPKR